MSGEEKLDSDYTIGASFVIEQKGIELVRAFLPESEWLWRKQNPDFFVDYNVETVEAGQPTGFQFAIQIKGTKSASIRNGFVRFRMSRKHLRYYRDSARLPVFILLADVDRKEVYWLFAQQYLREQAGRAQLNQQNSLTIKFHPGDVLSNVSRFRTALTGAEQYVRDLFPGSPLASVAHKKEFLQRLDPTIPISLSVDESGHEVLRLNPTTPFSLTFASQDAKARERLHDTIHRGDVFSAEMELKRSPASPLIQHVMPSGRYRIQFEPAPRHGTVQISGGGGQQVFLAVDGMWQRGTEQARFTGSLLGSPLSVRITIGRDRSDNLHFSVETPFEFGAWSGQRVSTLPWFDELRALISGLGNGGEVTHEILYRGKTRGNRYLGLR